jgi:hypothetical protein
MSFKRASVGIFCSTCRSSERWRYFAISALLGWWGIPWGIFWTLEALAKNAAGGKLPEEENAALLASLGQAFVDDGDFAGAREAWDASLRMKNDPQVERALLMLNAGGRGTSVTATSQGVARLIGEHSGTSTEIRPGDVVQVVRASAMRVLPDVTSSVLTSPQLGKTFVVLSKRAGWTQVRFAAGQSGWLTDSDLAKPN